MCNSVWGCKVLIHAICRMHPFDFTCFFSRGFMNSEASQEQDRRSCYRARVTWFISLQRSKRRTRGEQLNPSKSTRDHSTLTWWTSLDFLLFVRSAPQCFGCKVHPPLVVWKVRATASESRETSVRDWHHGWCNVSILFKLGMRMDDIKVLTNWRCFIAF